MRIPLGPMDNSYVLHWTYLCPLDPMDNSNVHWTYACPMDPLDPMDHWTYSLCHLTGLLPAWGRCQPMTSFKWTYLLYNQMSSWDIPVHWIQWKNRMSSGHVLVHWIQWTTEMSIGHMHVQWIHWIQWTIGHTPFAISQACYLYGVDAYIYDVIELTYLPHNQISTGHMPVHWTQWTNQMSTGHFNMSIGHLAEVLDINHLAPSKKLLFTLSFSSEIVKLLLKLNF
jgi:hypothetical protein